MRTALLVLACSTLALPLAAQEYAVSRRAYTFLEHDLTIEVLADAPGALQVIRGEPGRLEVAAHSREGLAAWTFGGWNRERMRLSALGSTATNYVIVVPEDVNVSVTLPGELVPRSMPWEPTAVLRWEGGASLPILQRQSRPPAVNDAIMPVHRAGQAPAVIQLADLSAIRSVEVRMEGDEFLVGSSRPLAFRPGDGPLVIRNGSETIELRLVVPTGTRAFELRGPDGVLVRADGHGLASGCRPSVAVSAEARQLVRIEPAAADFRCN